MNKLPFNPNLLHGRFSRTVAVAMLVGSGVFIEMIGNQSTNKDLADSVSNALKGTPNQKDCTAPQPLGSGPVSDRLKLIFREMAEPSEPQMEATAQSAAQIAAGKPSADTLVEACRVNLLDNHGGRLGEATIALALDTN